MAWQLLARWGVVAWELWSRESYRVPWRDVVRALRRLEARGQALGGRFVAGMSGEQYATPEAAALLAEVRRDAPGGRRGGGGRRRPAQSDRRMARWHPGARRPPPHASTTGTAYPQTWSTRLHPTIEQGIDTLWPGPIATNTRVDRVGLEQFIRPRHSAILSTEREDGTPQMSPVTMGVDVDGSILVASYPDRAKVRNLRARPELPSACSPTRSPANGSRYRERPRWSTYPKPWTDCVAYFRSISGEHPDWDEYRQAMIDQGKVLLRLVPDRWGPISKGGFRPDWPKADCVRWP